MTDDIVNTYKYAEDWARDESDDPLIQAALRDKRRVIPYLRRAKEYEFVVYNDNSLGMRHRNTTRDVIRLDPEDTIALREMLILATKPVTD